MQLDLLAVAAECTEKCASCGKKATGHCTRYYFGKPCEAPLCGGCEHSPGISYKHRKKEKP